MSGCHRWALIASLSLAAGCDLPGRPREADRPIPADQVLDFATLYGQNCAGCHGDDGKLGPAPPLNDALFLTMVPDALLLGVIADGRTGTPMPAFSRSRGGSLTDKQVEALARGLKPRWSKTVPSGPSSDATPAYAGSKGEHGRGLGVFRMACAGCHGMEGRGGAKMAGAINDRAFLALISDQALRRFAITGRPDLGMPHYAGRDGRDDDYTPMTSAEIDDLVALLARWRRGEGQEDRRTSVDRPIGPSTSALP